MFDILVYLFENYFDAGGYPDPGTLTRRLAAAGFANAEISRTLDWLTGLEQQGAQHYPAELAQNRSFRCYASAEMEKIDAAGRGFIAFLEQAGILNPLQRELVIDRALSMSDDAASLEKIKLIVLIVLWAQNQPVDSLVLEELLAASDPRYLH